MTDNRNDNRDETLSVDELVSQLKNNIASGAASSGEPEEADMSSLKRKNDPDKDIAAMLKKFMPEEKAESDEFELEEVTEEQSEFDLETDGEDVQMTLGDFDLDEPEMPRRRVNLEEAEQEETVSLSETETETETVTGDAGPEEPAEKATPQAQHTLFGAYAKKLEDAYEEKETEAAPAADRANGFADEELTPMPEIGEFSEESPAAPAEEASPLYVWDDVPAKKEADEAYFMEESTKNPLAFEDEDETPVVPDESAFADVSRTDVEEADTILFDAQSDKDVDDKDANLMIGLGYEEDLEAQVGANKVNEIANTLKSEMIDFIDVDNAYAYDGAELESTDQFRTVGNRYKKEHQTMKWRLIGTIVFAAALLLFEALGSFDVSLGGALNMHRYPVVHIMLSLQLLVFGCALSWRRLVKGLRDAITFAPTAASLPAVAILMTVLYDVVMALATPGDALQLYNFPAALCLLFMVGNDYFALEREIRAFNTIVAKKPKFAVSIAENAPRSMEEEMVEAFADEKDLPPIEKMADVKRVGFLQNYFRRTNQKTDDRHTYSLLIYPFIALAIAFGILSYVVNRSGATAFNISILTVLFGMPMSAVLAGSYPLYRAARNAFEQDATIIGDISVDEYADVTSVAFSDKDVFPVESTVTRGLKLYDNNAIYYVLYHLTSLYTKLGGPLKERLIQATSELGYSEQVELLRVENGGVEAVIDGKVKILAGQAEFMLDNGITARYDPDDERMNDEGCSSLFVALDGVLCAKLYVSYDIDPSFEAVMNDLAAENKEVLIRTYDPNINDDLLAAKLMVSRFPVRVVKGTDFENTSDAVDAMESGVVARSSIVSLAHAVALCSRIRYVRRRAKTVTTLSWIISLLIMALLTVFSSHLAVASVYVALYQIFWMIPLFIYTRLYIK